MTRVKKIFALLDDAGEKIAVGLGLWLKLTFFYWLLLFVLRLLFIACLADYLTKANMTQTATALWIGGRLSLQTSVIVAAIVFLPTAAGKFWGGTPRKLSAAINIVAIFAAVFLTAAAIPYYEIFHDGFNQMLFIGQNEDPWALFVTGVKEYDLPFRFAAVMALTHIFWWCFKYCLKKNISSAFTKLATAKFPAKTSFFRCTLLSVQAAAFYIVTTLAQYGGAWGWETEITWENAGLTNDPVLNVAVLDGAQSLVRAVELNRRYRAGTGLNYSDEEILELAAKLSGKPNDSGNVEHYLTKHATGAKISAPTHIFVILSESLANWPLLPRYENLHIANNLKKIIAADNSAYCPVFLPNGISTISAVTGTVTGLADANLYFTTSPKSFAAPFPTAIAPVMKRLGYRADFWYAGPSSWENIGTFVTAQGFDNFYGRGDLGEGEGSVWGIDDEYLYANIAAHISPDEPSFNVILNASNHAPYEVNLAAKGFNFDATKNALPKSAQNDKQLLRELGHYWYADHELGKFVATVEKKFPDSLFIIVGDHANRYHIDKTPNLYERYGVPFIVTGAGVKRDIFSPNAVGSHIDIAPTIVELIAPQNFIYVSLGTSLATNTRAVNYLLFAERNAVGIAEEPLKAENLSGENYLNFDAAAMSDYIAAVRGISFYIAK